jgi:hypothetical protein
MAPHVGSDRQSRLKTISFQRFLILRRTAAAITTLLVLLCGSLVDAMSPAGAATTRASAGPQFKLQPGAATDIGIGANGSVWVVGTNPVAGGYGIWHWNGGGWTAVQGVGAVRIAVDPSGNPWVVNSAHQIYRWTGKSWTSIPGMAATDIAVGANGWVWVLDTTPVVGGYEIRQYLGPHTWRTLPGGAIRIAVDPSGNPWVVNAVHDNVYHWIGKVWSGPLPNGATDIGVGANGSVWWLGVSLFEANYPVYPLIGYVLARPAGWAVDIAVGPSGNPWVISASHHIYSS